MTAYRIAEGGHPGYYIAADNHDGTVCLRNTDPTLTYNDPGLPRVRHKASKP